MSEVGTGFKTRLEYVLDLAFAPIPGGGTHEMRRIVAEKLIAAADAGERSIEGLVAIACQTLATFMSPAAIPDAV